MVIRGSLSANLAELRVLPAAMTLEMGANVRFGVALLANCAPDFSL